MPVICYEPAIQWQLFFICLSVNHFTLYTSLDNGCYILISSLFIFVPLTPCHKMRIFFHYSKALGQSVDFCDLHVLNDFLIDVIPNLLFCTDNWSPSWSLFVKMLWLSKYERRVTTIILSQHIYTFDAVVKIDFWRNKCMLICLMLPISITINIWYKIVTLLLGCQNLYKQWYILYNYRIYLLLKTWIISWKTAFAKD